VSEIKDTIRNCIKADATDDQKPVRERAASVGKLKGPTRAKLKKMSRDGIETINPQIKIRGKDRDAH
jgi:hypothetical protein